MQDDGFDVLSLDELEELQASGVEEIITRHGLVHDVEDGFEYMVLHDLTVVELVLQSYTSAKEL